MNAYYPLFSVIMPAYNAERHIQRAIDSVLSQEFQHFEIVVINDGSTDGTGSILESYKDPRVRVFTVPNGGVSAARQLGIANSNGRYIIFVDSDDEISPGLLSELKETIFGHNFPDLIRYQSTLVGDAPHKDHERYNFPHCTNVVMSGMEAFKTWSVPGKKYAVYWQFAFSQHLFKNLEFPQVRCYEDVALIPFLVAKSTSVVNIPFQGYKYYCSTVGSICNTRSVEAERSRARDFHAACLYSLWHLARICTTEEFSVVIEDFVRRIHSKFYKLSLELQEEFASLYGCSPLS